MKYLLRFAFFALPLAAIAEESVGVCGVGLATIRIPIPETFRYRTVETMGTISAIEIQNKDGKPLDEVEVKNFSTELQSKWFFPLYGTRQVFGTEYTYSALFSDGSKIESHPDFVSVTMPDGRYFFATIGNPRYEPHEFYKKHDWELPHEVTKEIRTEISRTASDKPTNSNK